MLSRLGWNERKFLVLQFAAAQVDEFTSEDLATALDIEIHAARTYLKRYHVMGLLARHRIYGLSMRAYRITKKGLSRLSYIRSV